MSSALAAILELLFDAQVRGCRQSRSVFVGSETHKHEVLAGGAKVGIRESASLALFHMPAKGSNNLPSDSSLQQSSWEHHFDQPRCKHLVRTIAVAYGSMVDVPGIGCPIADWLDSTENP